MMTGCNCLPDHDQNNYHQLPQTCLNADGIGIVMLGNSYNTISRQSPDSWSWVHSSVATNSLNIPSMYIQYVDLVLGIYMKYPSLHCECQLHY